jgi:anaerobic ribonucleoside-triphosphate reductase activating protein
LEDLLGQLDPLLPNAEGITISGGEPFDQPEALIGLLSALRKRTDVDILVYSGHAVEALGPVLRRAERLIDALITDPFELHSPHSHALRGSDNQRMHLLTAVGHERFSQYERLLTEQDKSLDVMFDEDGSVWFAGIPSRGDFQRLRDLLNDEGHLVQISADKARSR